MEGSRREAAGPACQAPHKATPFGAKTVTLAAFYLARDWNDTFSFISSVHFPPSEDVAEHQHENLYLAAFQWC